MGINTQFLWGVHVEGIGVDEGVSTVLSGAIFYEGLHAPPPSSSFTWHQVLAPIPPSIDQQVDLTTGNVRGSSFNFTVGLNSITAALLESRGIVAVGELTAALDSASSFVALGPGLANTMVYIGDESIKLLHAMTSGGDDGYFAGRGWFQSFASDHAEGTAVYSAPESIKDRKVTLYRLRLSNGTLDTRWQGYLNDVTSPDPGSLVLQCVAELDAQAGVVKNRNPTAFDGTFDQSSIGVFGGGFGPSSVFAVGSTHTYTAVSVGGGVSEARWFPANGGGILLTAYDDGFLDHATNNRVFPMRLGSSCEVSEGIERYKPAITEAMIVDRLGDRSGRAVSFTQALAAPYHPLSACLALLVSDGTWAPASYKVLAENIGLGLITVDVAQWETMITSTPELDRAVDQLVLCFDAATFKPLETIRQTLKIYGFFLTQAANGKITVKRVTTLTIGGVSAAFDLGVAPMVDGPLEKKNYLRRTTSKVLAHVGGLPWNQPATVEVLSVTDSKRAAMFDDGSLDFVVPTKKRGRAASVAYGASALAGLLFHSLPRARVRVPSAFVTGTECELLSEVALIDVPILSGWWIDRNGDRITGPGMEGLVDFVGLVESRKELTESGALELELYLIGYRNGDFSRERAPSLLVQSVSTNRLYCGAVSSFGDLIPDCERFTIGDEVSLRYVDGAAASGGEVRTVTGIVTDPPAGPENYVIVSSAFTTVTPGAMFLRLAESENYANTARYAFTDRSYCYLGTDADQVSDSNSVARTADPFGGSLGIS